MKGTRAERVDASFNVATRRSVKGGKRKAPTVAKRRVDDLGACGVYLYEAKSKYNITQAAVKKRNEKRRINV